MPDYDVFRNDDGSWSAKRDGASRASSNHDTQKAAYGAARGYAANGGGGEIKTHGVDGKIRDKNTIPPGNDPRDIPG